MSVRLWRDDSKQEKQREIQQQSPAGIKRTLWFMVGILLASCAFTHMETK